MELRKKLIEFAEWRENAIIPDTIEELVDDFLQQTKAQGISSNAVLAVSLPTKDVWFDIMNDRYPDEVAQILKEQEGKH